MHVTQGRLILFYDFSQPLPQRGKLIQLPLQAARGRARPPRLLETLRSTATLLVHGEEVVLEQVPLFRAELLPLLCVLLAGEEYKNLALLGLGDPALHLTSP